MTWHDVKLRYIRTYMHACMHTYIHYIHYIHYIQYIQYIHTYINTYRHTDIQTYRHTDIQTYRHTHILTYRHADVRTYGHTDIQTYRHTDIYIYTYAHIFIFICKFVLIYIYVYTHVCIYIYIHMTNICIYTCIWYFFFKKKKYLFLYMVQMVFKQQTWDLSWLMGFSTIDEQIWTPWPSEKRYELRLQSTVFIGNKYHWVGYISTDTHDIFSRMIYLGGMYIYIYIHIYHTVCDIMAEKEHIYWYPWWILGGWDLTTAQITQPYFN